MKLISPRLPQALLDYSHLVRRAQVLIKANDQID